jgi:hypothetical protein
MKTIGFIIIAAIVATLCVGLYILFGRPTTIVSPVPERSGIRVIPATSTVSPK